jgi:hypothetical protein
MGPCASKKDEYMPHYSINRLSSDETVNPQSFMSHPSNAPSSYTSKKTQQRATDCTTAKRSSINTLE